MEQVVTDQFVKERLLVPRVLRYIPDPNHPVYAKIKSEQLVNTLDAEVTAIIVNQSYKGCCLLLPDNENIGVGEQLVLVFNETDLEKCTIVWLENQDQGLVKIGLKIL